MLHTEINGIHYFVSANWAQASAPVYGLVTDEWDGVSEPALGHAGHQVADYRHSAAVALRRLIAEDFEASGCFEDYPAAYAACFVDELEFENGELVSIDGTPAKED